MTRVCSSPGSPKSKCCATGSQSLRMHEGGVIKRQLSTTGKSFKSLAKASSKGDCYAQLKSLLPNARHEENTSELALVEETIAYIAYLESILSASNDQDAAVSSATSLLKSMTV